MAFEPGLWQDHNLFLQLLWWEEEISHNLIQFFKGQLGMEPGHVIRLQMHHVFQQVVEILEDIPQHPSSLEDSTSLTLFSRDQILLSATAFHLNRRRPDSERYSF